MTIPLVSRRAGLCLSTLALSALAAAGCGKDSNPGSPSPSTTAVFSEIQRDILTPSCVSCHTNDGRTPAGDLDLRPGVAYGNLFNRPSAQKSGAMLVVAGNAAGSYLVQKLEGAADIVGVRMPRNGPPYLSDAQVAVIRQWIQDGAMNN
ncbi:MAG: c-type cytochrome [Vicinamibacterales bacterium]